MRPPKSVRARLREADDWTTPTPTPPKFSLVDEFRSQNGPPLPMPGAFSPVFNAMSAIENIPIRFTLHGDVFVRIFDFVHDTVLSGRLKEEEFRAQGTTPEGVVARLFSASCLALAIHVARIHSKFSRDTTGLSRLSMPELPVCIMDYVRDFGEFTGVDGRQWILYDFESTVKSLVRASDKISEGHPYEMVLSRFWLPVCPNDGNTHFVLASRFLEWFRAAGYHLRVEDVLDYIASGEIPACVSCHLSALSPDQAIAVTRIFQMYSTSDQFIQMYSDDVGVKTLRLLNLALGGADAHDLCFEFDLLRVAARLSRIWTSVQRLYAKTLGVVFARNTTVPSRGGHYCQAAEVEGVDSFYQVNSFYALTDEDKAVLCCYGNMIDFSTVPTRFHQTGHVASSSLLSSVVCYDLGV